MDRVLRCHCGFEARGQDEETLVADVRRHAQRAHGMALTDDEALLLAFRAELDEVPPTTIPSRSPNSEEEER